MIVETGLSISDEYKRHSVEGKGEDFFGLKERDFLKKKKKKIKFFERITMTIKKPQASGTSVFLKKA